MIEEGKRYIFKKDYITSAGKINEGREVYFFKNAYWMDGIIVPHPFDKDLEKLFNDDKFIKEYTTVKNFSDSRYVIA